MCKKLSNLSHWSLVASIICNTHTKRKHMQMLQKDVLKFVLNKDGIL